MKKIVNEVKDFTLLSDLNLMSCVAGLDCVNSKVYFIQVPTGCWYILARNKPWVYKSYNSLKEAVKDFISNPVRKAYSFETTGEMFKWLSE